MSIATVLFSVIGGLARVFFNHTSEDGKSFKAAAQRYPMEDEPSGAIRTRRSFADTLYGMYRCNLIHSLGLNMARRTRMVRGKKRKGRWMIVSSAERYVVARSLFNNPAQLDALERPTGRPAELPATLKRENGKIRLDVDALYCGVRRLVRAIAHDPVRQRIGERVLREWVIAETAADAARASQLATQSGATPELVHFSSRQSIEETLGAVTAEAPWNTQNDGGGP
ncbi:MAG: hypothetical protein WDO56_35250 [Gammaproteobacteria bacterium]